MYSITSRDSFETCNDYLKYVRNFNSKFIILVGNKIDQEERREVTFEVTMVTTEK